jgi:cytoskeleton protein RodZ
MAVRLNMRRISVEHSMNDPMNNPTDAGSSNAGGDDRVMPSAPGAQLAAHRQERGWTIEQVASQLNLAPRQVVAIEADDYPSLPGMPIVRGFIRAYAKLLKIDAAPLLASLGGETMFAAEPISPRKTLSAPFSETRLPSMMDRQGISSKWLIGLLLAVLLGVAIWATQQNGELASISKSASSQMRDSIAYLSGSESSPKADAGKTADASTPPATADAPTQVPANAASETPAAVVPANGAQAPVSTQQQEASPSSSTASAPTAASTPAPVQSAPEKTAGATPQPSEPTVTKDALVLMATQDSWIEVKRTSNKSVLLARLVKAGTTETVEISEPVTVVVGNAAGVEATLRGAPVNIKGGAGNVARLTLK